jgi:hypothetical protein
MQNNTAPSYLKKHDSPSMGCSSGFEDRDLPYEVALHLFVAHEDDVARQRRNPRPSCCVFFQ